MSLPIISVLFREVLVIASPTAVEEDAHSLGAEKVQETSSSVQGTVEER